MELYFIEHRGKVLELAAFLDRIDRIDRIGKNDRADDTDALARSRASGQGDARLTALRHAVAILIDGGTDRTRRVLELWSDPSTEPIASASVKGAVGVWTGSTPGKIGGESR